MRYTEQDVHVLGTGLIIGVIVAALVLALGAGSSHATTIRVPADQPTIQAGIDAAVDGDIVLVADGLYTGAGNRDISVSKSVVIRSKSGALATTIDCGGAGRGFHFLGGTSAVRTIEGFTITDGDGGYGGGALCNGQNVTIRNCWFEANTAGEGGALALMNAGSVTIDSCYFVDNVGSSSAGAIYLRSSTDIVVSRCVGWHNREGGNFGGGFMYAYASDNLTIVNNTIVGNIGKLRGAGLTFWNTNDADIRNNIVAFNEGASGVFLGGNNPGLVAEYNDVYGNLSGDYSGVTPGTGSISADPLLADIAMADFSLLAESPCVDAGDSDLQYNDPDGSRNDIGALPGPCQSAGPDTDGDGVADNCDMCPGFDDNLNADGDVWPDDCDNCPNVAHYSQSDTDGDGVGDTCDNCVSEPNPDQTNSDTDELGDDCDNCPATASTDQTDWDNDGLGDACDDSDGDGVFDVSDNCQVVPNAEQEDGDSDGVGNVCDNCESAWNPEQEDWNENDLGDACEDSDSDGVLDGLDNCPSVDNPDQLDFDSDGVGNHCDDSDGDGWLDSEDNCWSDPNPDHDDTDLDGVGDGCDNCPEGPNADQQDSDYDRAGDVCDNCPEDPNPDQADWNNNGVGDMCDPNCCIGSVGNANGLGGDIPTIGDVSVMIDARFITARCEGIIPCLAEADINQSGGCNPTCDDITIGDIAILISSLFIGLDVPYLPECLVCPEDGAK
jgi:hypothetical protein